MAKSPKGVAGKRIDVQAEHVKRFENQTGKSAFSPALRTRKTAITMWADQGESLERILGRLGGSVNREELQRFLDHHGIALKKIKSKQGSASA